MVFYIDVLILTLIFSSGFPSSSLDQGGFGQFLVYLFFGLIGILAYSLSLGSLVLNWIVRSFKKEHPKFPAKNSKNYFKKRIISIKSNKTRS